ncbi:MAG: hypothetical protein ACOCVM_07965 [Desulfovibrionaceae bacterium]
MKNATLILALTLWLVPALASAADPAPPKNATGVCADNDASCAKFSVNPAQNCQSGGFTDNITTYFYQQMDGGWSNLALKVGPTPQNIWLKPGTTWKVAAVDDFFGDQYPCCIKVVNSTDWDYANNCTAANTQGLQDCIGCQPMSTPTGKDAFGVSLINSGCVFKNRGQVNRDRVYLLDHQKNNYIFRGPKPVYYDKTASKWTFDYKNFMAALKDRFTKQMPKGKTFPDPFVLVDVSLISNSRDCPSDKPNCSNEYKEHYALMAEYVFFGGQQGDPPSMKPQVADSTAPFAKAAGDKNAGAFLWWQMLTEDNGGGQASKLPALVQNITVTMNKTNPASYVYYIHCDAGSDRTGEVAISYLLKSRGMDSKPAYVYGTTIFKDPDNGNYNLSRDIPLAAYRDGAFWYCDKIKGGNVCDFSDKTDVPPLATDCVHPWDSACAWN